MNTLVYNFYPIELKLGQSFYDLSTSDEFEFSEDWIQNGRHVAILNFEWADWFSVKRKLEASSLF